MLAIAHAASQKGPLINWRTWRDADRSFCAWQIDTKYKALACILMAFEKKLYGTWLDPVEATITAHLKQPLLREDPASKRCARSSVLKKKPWWC